MFVKTEFGPDELKMAKKAVERWRLGVAV